MIKFIKIALILISLSYTSVCTGSDLLSNDIRQAYTYYHNGDINKSIEKFDEILQGINKESNQENIEEKFFLLSEKLEICYELFLLDCQSGGLAKLKKIYDEIKDKKSKERLWGVYYYHFIQSIPNQPNNELDKIKIGWLLNNIGQNYFVKFNLLLSKKYLENLDRNKSREYLNIALAGLLTYTDLHDLQFAKHLSTIFSLLSTLSDPSMAGSIHTITGDYMAKNLSGSLPMLLQFRIAESDYLYRNLNFKGAIWSLKESEKMLNKIKSPKKTKVLLERLIYTKLAISCYFIGNFSCASAAAERHPFNSFLETNKAEEFKNYASVSIFLAIKLAVSLKSGVELTDKFLDLFNDVGINKKTEDESIGYPYRLYALALKNHSISHGSGDELVIEAGKRIIDRDRQALISTDDGFFIFHAVDKLILADALYAINRKKNTQEYADLILKIIYSHNRGILDVDTAAIERLAKSGSQENKRLIHSKLRVANNFKGLQLISLENEVSFRDSNPRNRIERKPGFELYSILDEFNSKLKAMNLAVKSLAEKQVYNDFPDIRKLQTTLNDNEAYLTFSAVHNDQLSLFCATKENAYLEVIKYDYKILNRDIKLIDLAVRSTHQPSPILDSMYPVTEAVRLYKTFISPMSECLIGKTNLIWSPDDTLRGFPISALLANTPKKINDRWALNEAEWLGLSYGITYAGSSNRFIYSRALRKNIKRDNSFFGIGDPSLNTPDIEHIKEPKSSNENPSVEALMHTINKQFPELPESGNELKEIYKIAGAGSKILTGNSATETNLRREILNQYSVISFATHGVLKNEVAGINQESLLLTPEMTSNASRNGILTSTEIADLNLSADLIVLSACNTANEGMNAAIKGITGLSTSFSLAGSPTIMASLWTVDDLSTRRLMTLFHKNYFGDKNKNISLSLREATKLFIKESKKQYSHPRFWAPFVIFGDGGSIVNRKKNEKRSIKVLNTYIDDGGTGGGYISSASLSDDGDFIYVGGNRNYNTDTHKWNSYIYKFDTKKNKKIWERKNLTFSEPHSMIAYDDGVYFSSHKVFKKRHKLFLSKVDTKGNLLWKKEIEIDNNDSGFQTSLSKDKEGNLSLITAERLYKDELQPIFKAHRITQDGSVELSKIVDMELEKGVLLSKLKHLSNNGNLFISVSYSHFNENNESAINKYGLHRSCRLIESTNIITINKSDLIFQSMHRIDNILINKMIVDKVGDIVSAGMKYSGCRAKRSAIALRITQDNHKVIYERKNISDGVGTDIRISNQNNYIFTGFVQRDTGYGRIKHDSKDYKNNDEYFLKRLAFQNKRLTFSFIEPFIDIFDSGGAIKSKEILQFGTSITNNGAIIVEDNLLMYGAIGNDPALLRISY